MDIIENIKARIETIPEYSLVMYQLNLRCLQKATGACKERICCAETHSQRCRPYVEPAGQDASEKTLTESSSVPELKAVLGRREEVELLQVQGHMQFDVLKIRPAVVGLPFRKYRRLLAGEALRVVQPADGPPANHRQAQHSATNKIDSSAMHETALIAE